MKAKSRNSSIELLRILSMFVIVLHHYALKGTFDWNPYNPKYSGAIKVNLFLHYFGKLGVVLFVMIGAYFLCEKQFNFRRPINLIVTTVFYSFGLYFVFKLFDPTGIWGTDSVVRVLLPFPLPSGYWFVYSYIVMLFAMPFLNIIIRSLTKQKLLLLIIGLILLWSFLSIGLQIFNSKPDTFVDSFGYTPTTYFFLIYFVSAYIRKYSGKILNSKVYTMFGAVMCVLIAILLSALAINEKLFNGIADLFDVNSPLVLLTSIFIFSYFKNSHFNSRIINYIAGSMFGVYLIHEDSFVRPFIWQNIFSSKVYAGSGIKYLLAGLLFSLIVFIICILIDIIFRRLIFERIIKKIVKYIDAFLVKVELTILCKRHK